MSEDVIVAADIELHRVGMSSTGPAGEEVTGAAVDSSESPSARAYFELLERVSTLEAIGRGRESYPVLTRGGEHIGERPTEHIFPESDEPGRWRYARSNGIALHKDWRHAAEHALWELAERDRVLRAWLGETVPERLPPEDVDADLRQARAYDWAAYSFPEAPDSCFSAGVEVVGVFGFPSSDNLPLVSGYAAAPSRRHALDAAAREARQVLGFLWGEEALQPPAEPGPTALHHLEHFQWPPHRGRLRQWLDGAHARPVKPVNKHRRPADVVYVDLTPPWLAGGLRVAKAACNDAIPLAFGAAPFFSHLPSDLRVHPIG